MRPFVLLSLLPLATCAVSYGGPQLISGQSPPAAQSFAGEPQPVGSLPPGAEGIGHGPNGRQLNLGSISVPSPL